LLSFPFFKNKSRQFISVIGPMLKPQKILKNDYIYSEGSPIDEIYFLSKGKAALVISDKQDIAYLQIDSGFYFGEVDLLETDKNKSGRRQFTAKALSDCEVYVLSVSDLYKINVDFNNVFNELLDQGEIRLKRLISLKEATISRLKSQKQPLKKFENRKEKFAIKLSPNFTNLKFIDEEETLQKEPSICTEKNNGNEEISSRDIAIDQIYNHACLQSGVIPRNLLEAACKRSSKKLRSNSKGPEDIEHFNKSEENLNLSHQLPVYKNGIIIISKKIFSCTFVK
jgi:CRP-like cAMP-binding protein